MLGLFVSNPWPLFYRKGMKTWEIRSYPISYRGDLLVIDSQTNKVVCMMQLINCIPLSKKRWEMNYDKHRTSCSYEALPYRSSRSSGYAWILQNPFLFDEEIYVSRSSSKPYITLTPDIIANKPCHPINFSAERIACKFLDNNMLLFWLRKDYFALIAQVDLATNKTTIITSEISPNEVKYVLSQLQANQ